MSNPAPSASRVLVAGDSLTCGGVLVIFLENAGYDVISVRDGNQALKALRLHPFDLAVLDHDMPDHGALAALTELRGFLPRLPVIVRAGPLSPHESSRYGELGAEILLCKSVDPAALREKINATLGNTLLAPAFPCPLLAGRSLLAARLNTDVARLREFRSVALLEGRHGAGRSLLSPEAIKWIDRHRWTGDYTQLHRTIELARRLAGVTSTISDTHLATAFAQESTCDIPLFHDLLFHVHSGDDT